MDCWGTADYYALGVTRFKTPLSRCSSCKAIRRDLTHEMIISHCGVASYTNLSNEDRFRRGRMPFFEFLYELASKSGLTPLARCLDFGCSYGHLLQVLEARGCDAAGIEVVDGMRTHCQAKGLTVFTTLEQWAEYKGEQKLDLVTMVDSLYYVDDPRRLLTSARRLLRKDGILLVRISNRNWITWLLKRICGRTHYGSWLGDATIAYGKKSIERLLVNSGFSIVRWVYWERRKRLPIVKRALYNLASLVTWTCCGRMALSAGIIVVARNSGPCGEDLCRPRHEIPSIGGPT